MTEQNFTAWLADHKAELTDIIGAARAGFAGGYASALEQIGAGGVGDVSPVRAALSSRPVQGGEITEAEIDRIAALTEKGMEEGLRGFMRTWGWQQFARTLVENLAPYGLRLSSAPAQEPMTDEQAEQIRLEVGFAGGASRFVEFTRAIERHHGICKE